MPDHLLTFELNKDSDELFIHADLAGLQFLGSVLSRLATHVEAGRLEHDHLITEDWAGTELSSAALGQSTTLIHHVKIYGLPKKEK